MEINNEQDFMRATNRLNELERKTRGAAAITTDEVNEYNELSQTTLLHKKLIPAPIEPDETIPFAANPSGEISVPVGLLDRLIKAGGNGFAGNRMKGIPTEDSINMDIQLQWIDPNLISDGYHTFGELYAHRIALWIRVCELEDDACLHERAKSEVWRSQAHSDGSVWDGWFILGMGIKAGEQKTYHLPMSEWERCWFAQTLDRAPEWDGHTSADVLARI